MKSHLPLLFILSILIAGVSCKKGDTGPAGPAGTANVLYSDWFTPSAYTKDTVFGTYGFYHDTAVSAITQAILDSGSVIVYGKLDGYVTSIWPTDQVETLPISITYSYGANANIDVWSALITPGNLRIELTSSQNAYGSIANSHKFRYLIIPGGKHISASAIQTGGSGQVSVTESAGSGGSASTKDIDYAHIPYGELCRRLGIPQ